MQKIRLPIPQANGTIVFSDVEFDDDKRVSNLSSYPVYISTDEKYIIKRWEGHALQDDNYKKSPEYHEAQSEAYYYQLTHRQDKTFYISEPTFHKGKGEPSGSIYLIMTNLPGQTLDEHPALRAMELSDSLKLIIILANLVESLHANTIKTGHSIIHGDLKPQNILLHITESGQFELNIIDYGTGHTPKHKSFNPNHLFTTALEVNRENIYSAPEVKDSIIGFKTDIFMLGGVIETILHAHLTEEKNEDLAQALLDLIRQFIQRMRAEKINHRPHIAEVLRFFILAKQYLSQPEKTVQNYAKMACAIQWGWPDELSACEYLFDEVEFSSRVIEQLKTFTVEKFIPLIGQSDTNIFTFVLMIADHKYLAENAIVKRILQRNAEIITQSAIKILQNMAIELAIPLQTAIVTKTNALGRLLAGIPQSKLSKLFSQAPLDIIAKTKLAERAAKKALR